MLVAYIYPVPKRRQSFLGGRVEVQIKTLIGQSIGEIERISYHADRAAARAYCEKVGAKVWNI